MQQFLKPAGRPARAEIVSSELLDELLLAAADGALASLDVGLAREASSALASALERTRTVRNACWLPWRTSSLGRRRNLSRARSKSSQADIAFAREFGYAIKSLAVAKRAGDRIEASVRPTMVPRRHALANVNGALNAIAVHGEALGDSLYVGAGAGMMPTATAVVADLMDVARNRVHGCRGRIAPLGYPVRTQTRARTVPLDALHGEYYLRFMLVDRPGGLGRIASILGVHDVSIAAVIQREREHGRVVPVVIRTHEAREQALRRAVRAIDRLAVVRGRSTVIRIEEDLG